MQRGGKCERCGYSTYLGALDFHHLDPTEKEFTVGDRDFKLEQCVEEVKKCIMICLNKLSRKSNNRILKQNKI